MQIPEWYTGSDESGRVAAGIERAIERMDERTADHTDVADLEKLLATEEEVNWRNFLLGLVGTIHYDLEEIDSAHLVQPWRDYHGQEQSPPKIVAGGQQGVIVCG